MRKYIVSLLLLCLLASGANSAADLGNSSVISPVDSSNGSGTCPSWLGSAAPSTLDDSGRCLQGAIAREWQNRSFAVTSTGSADAYVVAYTVAPAALRTGQVYSFITNFGNTGTATVNINSLGAKTIKKDVAGTLTALSSGDMGSGQYVMLAYNGTDMIWVNWQGAATDLSAYAPLASANTFTANQTITSTDAGAGAGPGLSLYRNSATPAASDALGYIVFEGEDSGGNQTAYAYLVGTIIDPTDGSEDSSVRIQTLVAGSLANQLHIQSGVYTQGATSGAMGAGTVNATEYYKNGVALTNGGMTLLSTLTTTSGTTHPVTGISSTYRKLYIEIEDVSFTGNVTLTLAVSSDNGGSYGTAIAISAALASAAQTITGTTEVSGLQLATLTSVFGVGVQPLTRRSGSGDLVTPFILAPAGTSGAIDAIQFAGGTFDAGTIRVYGVK